MNDIYVRVENLSKRFFVLQSEETIFRSLGSLIKNKAPVKELWALRDLSFCIRRGEKLAVIGKNGSGKTTLFRILANIYDKTSGKLEVLSEPKALFRFWVGFNGELSLLDNIFLFGAVHGINRDLLKPRTSIILEMAELSHLRFIQLKKISVGQLQKLAFSIFFQFLSDFLIFDESLTFVDQQFMQRCECCFEEIYNSERTVIFTSHNASFLRKYCKTAIWLDEGRIRMFGDIEKVLNEYEKFSLA